MPTFDFTQLKVCDESVWAIHLPQPCQTFVALYTTSTDFLLCSRHNHYDQQRRLPHNKQKVLISCLDNHFVVRMRT